MDLARITNHNWHTFSKKFPEAFQFLERRSLWNEYQELKRIPEPSRNDWQRGRLKELQEHYENSLETQSEMEEE